MAEEEEMNAEDPSGEPGNGAPTEMSVEGEVNPEAGENMPDELEQLSAQSAEYLDGWQRARAELANYKKRVERERKDAYTRAAGDILAQFLDVVDDFERALRDLPEEQETASWVQGIELVHRKMKGIMDSYGIEPIDATGQPFDPNLHEAISHEETDVVPEGYVIDVVKQGYSMGDRILRAATVRVAK
ncbi:MAG: nucleotide exchange factor GrpE [Anaerolineales bacterium]